MQKENIILKEKIPLKPEDVRAISKRGPRHIEFHQTGIRHSIDGPGSLVEALNQSNDFIDIKEDNYNIASADYKNGDLFNSTHKRNLNMRSSHIKSRQTRDYILKSSHSTRRK